MSNPLATPLPWNLAAKDYAEFTAPFFANYAAAALDRAQVTKGTRVLDVAAGPGTLALLAAARGCQTTAIDFSPSMIEQLNARAKRENLAVDARVGDGQALPLADASFEAAFSMFGLMFFPDRAAGFKEMLRVLVPGGLGAIASWQPVESVPMAAEVFTTMREFLPGLPFGGAQAPLVSATEVLNEMQAAGFRSVVVEEVSATAEAPSLDEAWTFMFRGSPPLGLVRQKVGEETWLRIEQGIVAALRRKYGSGPQKLTMTANLGLGRKL